MLYKAPEAIINNSEVSVLFHKIPWALKQKKKKQALQLPVA